MRYDFNRMLKRQYSDSFPFTGLPRSGKKSLENEKFSSSGKSQGIWVWDREIGQGNLRQGNWKLGLRQGNWKKKLTKVREKSGNFKIYWKLRWLAIFLIFRNINLQNWPHSFVKWSFYSLKVSALLEDLVAEDSYKGSWEAIKNVWKMEKSRGNGKCQGILKSKMSGNPDLAWLILYHCPG